MKDYYSILDISRKTTTNEILAEYIKKSHYNYNIGYTDYDNMRELVRINDILEAKNLLTDRINRLKYDIKRYGFFEYVDTNFSNQSQINEFIDILKIELISLNEEKEKKDKLISNLEKRKESLLSELINGKIDASAKLEIEIGKVSDLFLANNNLEKELTNISDQLKKLADQLDICEKENEKLTKNLQIIDDQNKRLLKVAKNHKEKIFKIVITLSFFFMFIILLVYLNR